MYVITKIEKFFTRLGLGIIPLENKKFIRFYIESLNDLYKYKDKLIEVLNRYLVR